MVHARVPKDKNVIVESVLKTSERINEVIWNETDINNKMMFLIQYIKSLVSGYKVKAEYSTNDNDECNS